MRMLHTKHLASVVALLERTLDVRFELLTSIVCLSIGSCNGLV